jgi:hypothetical protein
MSDNNNENKAPEGTMDFFKHMDETIRREEAKKAVVLPMSPTAPKEPYNPNREYQRRYSHRIADRMWIGPRRYQ